MSDKGEISWKRETDDGARIQVYARNFGGKWSFYHREKRYDVWQEVPEPPLEDWLELLDSVRRRINRRLVKPQEEAHVIKLIRERFPDADLGE